MNTFQTNLTRIKNQISSYFDTYCQTKSSTNPWYDEALELFTSRFRNGKMLRGYLVSLGYSLFSDKQTEDVIIAGTAMECFQTSFLVHDDIMDEDIRRRGMPTLHTALAEKYSKSLRPNKTAESVAITIADMGFFWGFDLLSNMKTNMSNVIRLIAQELALVGSGQIGDISIADAVSIPTEQEIVSMYALKTGRYSIGLPLAIGALIAGQSNNVVEQLVTLGSSIGIAFQIHDDELNLYGKPNVLGKPVGSDLQKKKKTLHFVRCFIHAAPEDKTFLTRYLKTQSVTNDDIKHIMALMEKYAIKMSCEKEKQSHFHTAMKHISHLSGRPPAIDELKTFCEFCITRLL